MSNYFKVNQITETMQTVIQCLHLPDNGTITYVISNYSSFVRKSVSFYQIINVSESNKCNFTENKVPQQLIEIIITNKHQKYLYLGFFFEDPSVDSGWTEFGPYGHCSVSCGEGTRSRSRTCKNHGGVNCVGSATETTSCHLSACPSQ